MKMKIKIKKVRRRLRKQKLTHSYLQNGQKMKRIVVIR